MTSLRALLRRDLRLGFCRGAEGFGAVLFFGVALTMFPFALGRAPEALAAAAPGLIWVLCLLAALLPLESLYHRDAEDGTFDLLMISGVPAPRLVAAKMLAHVALAGLPLLLAAGPCALALGLSPRLLPALLASLALGMIYLSLLGGFAAVLTLGARRPGLLLGLIVLPLCLPMLILGVLGSEAALAELSPRPYLLLQAALVAAGLTLASAASAAALRLHLRS